MLPPGLREPCAMTEHPFPYEGPEELRQPILTALRRVVVSVCCPVAV